MLRTVTLHDETGMAVEMPVEEIAGVEPNGCDSLCGEIEVRAETPNCVFCENLTMRREDKARGRGWCRYGGGMIHLSSKLPCSAFGSKEAEA